MFYDMQTFYPLCEIKAYTKYEQFKWYLLVFIKSSCEIVKNAFTGKFMAQNGMSTRTNIFYIGGRRDQFQVFSFNAKLYRIALIFIFYSTEPIVFIRYGTANTQREDRKASEICLGLF